MVTYRFARCVNGSTVDVQHLDQVSRRELGPFECFGCRNVLIARLPQKGIAKHFAHTQQCHCSGETYLHALAKNQIAASYRRAVAEGVPFILSRETLIYPRPLVA